MVQTHKSIGDANAEVIEQHLLARLAGQPGLRARPFLDIAVLGIPRQRGREAGLGASSDDSIEAGRHLQSFWVPCHTPDPGACIVWNAVGCRCVYLSNSTVSAARAVWPDGRPGSHRSRSTPSLICGLSLGRDPDTTAGPDDNPELLVMNLCSLEVGRYGLVPDSGCPNCGLSTDDSASAARIELANRPKKSLDGYRLAPAHALVDSHSDNYLNPVCGMLGPQATQDEDHRFNVQVKGRFFEPGPFRFPIDWGGNTNCYRDSLSVGLLEGLERHAGIRPRSRKRSVYDSLRNLGDDALDPSTCGLYEPICYELDSELTPFSPDLKIHWVWGYSLTESRPILVPSQMVYYGNDCPENHSSSMRTRMAAPREVASRRRSCMASSNSWKGTHSLFRGTQSCRFPGSTHGAAATGTFFSAGPD